MSAGGCKQVRPTCREPRIPELHAVEVREQRHERHIDHRAAAACGARNAPERLAHVGLGFRNLAAHPFVRLELFGEVEESRGASPALQTRCLSRLLRQRFHAFRLEPERVRAAAQSGDMRKVACLNPAVDERRIDRIQTDHKNACGHANPEDDSAARWLRDRKGALASIALTMRGDLFDKTDTRVSTAKRVIPEPAAAFPGFVGVRFVLVLVPPMRSCAERLKAAVC